jgi:hypothetical protein
MAGARSRKGTNAKSIVSYINVNANGAISQSLKGMTTTMVLHMDDVRTPCLLSGWVAATDVQQQSTFSTLTSPSALSSQEVL